MPTGTLGRARPDLGSRPKIPVDPRIRQRRIEVARRQGRRRLRVLLGCLAAAGLLGAGAGSLYTPIFEVRHVLVAEHGSPVPRSQVVEAAGLSGSPQMIDVSQGALERRLDAIPWIGDASVAVDWPDTVRVAVVVRSAVGQVKAGGAWALVDATGRVLGLARPAEPGLPVLQGIGAPPAVGRWLPGTAGPSAPAGRPVPGPRTAPGAVVGFAACLPGSVLGDVASISAGRGGRLSAVVYLPRAKGSSAGGRGESSGRAIPVVLGSGSELQAKALALGALLEGGDLSGVTEIDLTVPDRPVALTGPGVAGSVSTQAGG